MSGVFDAYGAYYDLFYEDKDYAGEAEYVAALLRGHAPAASALLDLGCGTGGHAEWFAGMGWSVTGIDLSPTMLERAARRRSELSPEVAARLTYEEGDIRTCRLDARFDAVVSLFHVFSYQTSDEDLRAAFETAAAHLCPGGILVVDFWYGPAVLSERPEVREKRLEDAKVRVLRIAEPTLFPDESRVQVDFTVLVEQRSTGATEEVRESHYLRYLFLTELEELCAPCFQVLETRGWMTSSAPTPETWSVVAVLRRTP